MEKYRKEAGELARCEEDVLSYALFPQVAMNFFKARKEAKEGKKELDINVSVSEII